MGSLSYCGIEVVQQLLDFDILSHLNPILDTGNPTFRMLALFVLANISSTAESVVKQIVAHEIITRILLSLGKTLKEVEETSYIL